MANQNNRYLSLCKILADKSKLLYKHGSVIVKNRRIISVGWNCGKTHPRLKKFKHASIWLHAEMHAIIGLSVEQLKNSTLYVARITDGRNLANSKPCDSCLEACRMVDIKKVVYSMRSSKIGEIVL